MKGILKKILTILFVYPNHASCVYTVKRLGYLFVLLSAIMLSMMIFLIVSKGLTINDFQENSAFALFFLIPCFLGTIGFCLSRNNSEEMIKDFNEKKMLDQAYKQKLRDIEARKNRDSVSKSLYEK